MDMNISLMGHVSNFSELLRYIYEKYCKLNSHYLERRSLIKLHYAWTKIYSKKNQNLFYNAKVELYLTCVKVVRTFELVKKNAKEMLSLKSNLLVLFCIFSNFPAVNQGIPTLFYINSIHNKCKVKRIITKFAISDYERIKYMLSRGQPHPPDINHCILINLTPRSLGVSQRGWVPELIECLVGFELETFLF